MADTAALWWIKYDTSFHEMVPERARLMSPNADMKDKRNTI
jgi:hypothetical protein